MFCSIYKCESKDTHATNSCKACGTYPLCKKHAHYAHNRCITKTYFDIKYDDKDQAKQCGLWFDPEVRKWYSPNIKSYNLAIQLFSTI